MNKYRTPTVWVGLGAVLVLLAGLAVAMGQWRRAPSTPARTVAPGPAARPDTSSDQVIERALGSSGESDKTRWVSEIPNLDVSDLEAGRLAIFLQHANTQRCRCGCGYTLAACRVYDTSCDKSGPRVKALLDSVRQGRISDARGLRQPPRVDSPGGRD